MLSLYYKHLNIRICNLKYCVYFGPMKLKNRLCNYHQQILLDGCNYEFAPILSPSPTVMVAHRNRKHTNCHHWHGTADQQVGK